MRRFFGALLIVSALAGAGVLGLAAGRLNTKLPGWLDKALPTSAMQGAAMADPTGPIIYYRSPHGLPDYSLTPKKTVSGKDYVAVRASEDVSFEEKTGRNGCGEGRRAAHQVLSQPDGIAGHLADAEEGFDGDGLHSRLRR